MRTTAWSSTIRTVDHRTGTSTTSVVPASLLGLDRHAPLEQLDPLAHPLEPEAAVLASWGVEAAAVVLEHEQHAAVLRRHEDAGPGRVGMLGDIGQSLLDDPVEGGLDLGRETLDAQLGLEVDLDPRLGEKVLVSRSSALTRP